jgi:hypothetical protein
LVKQKIWHLFLKGSSDVIHISDSALYLKIIELDPLRFLVIRRWVKIMPPVVFQ